MTPKGWQVAPGVRSARQFCPSVADIVDAGSLQVRSHKRQRESGGQGRKGANVKTPDVSVRSHHRKDEDELVELTQPTLPAFIPA